MKLWIVGQDKEETWEFVGVFSDPSKAESACLDASYFVGPTHLDETAPTESVEWVGGYRPSYDAPVYPDEQETA